MPINHKKKERTLKKCWRLSARPYKDPTPPTVLRISDAAIGACGAVLVYQEYFVNHSKAFGLIITILFLATFASKFITEKK